MRRGAKEGTCRHTLRSWLLNTHALRSQADCRWGHTKEFRQRLRAITSCVQESEDISIKFDCTFLSGYLVSFRLASHVNPSIVMKPTTDGSRVSLIFDRHLKGTDSTLIFSNEISNRQVQFSVKLAMMFFVRSKQQIGDSVIGLVTIYVMNLFIRLQPTLQLRFHHQAASTHCSSSLYPYERITHAIVGTRPWYFHGIHHASVSYLCQHNMVPA